MPDRLTVADIDLCAYRHNLQVLRAKIPQKTRLMAVIKANAYGHGAVDIARCAEKHGADYLGVVCLYEARELREVGIKLPILILNYIDPESAMQAIDLGCEITVIDTEVITAVGESGRQARLHLKVDTGMHRAGANPTDILALAKEISSYPNLELVGMFTHFANSDDADLSFARTQLQTFTRVINELHDNGIKVPIIHAANSGATLSLPESHFDLVRPGIASYGLNPFAKDHPAFTQFAKEFQPVLTLRTQVVQIKDLAIGESVGYGRTFVTKHPMRIALLPIGYGDGFRRAPRNWGEVLIRGQRVPILGRVSMDQTSIDVTDIQDVSLHDEVILLGRQGMDTLTAEEIGEKLGTINYEVVTGVTQRVSRVYEE